MDPLSPILGGAGLAWGLVSDRIAARWPAHDDGSVRPIDWRTPVVAGFGALALGILPTRFTDPAELAFLGLYLAAMTLLLATDLDQRLLPDVVTLPLIVFVAAGLVIGLSPFVGLDRGLEGAILAAIVFPLGLLVLAIPFGQGAIGLGDIKLLVGSGLLLGLERAFTGLVVGALGSAVVILVLMAARRIGRRSYIPFGPFLIGGIAWAILAPS